MYLTRHVLLQYIFRKPFGIHSPFLYDFACRCLYARDRLPDFDLIENLRHTLLQDQTILDITDFGRGTGRHKRREGDAPLLYKRKISSIARHSLQSPAMCRLLYRTVQYFSPDHILELGTSLGISTAYLAKAAPKARIITLEGCEQTADRARSLFRKTKLHNIEVITGDFKQTLGEALQKLQKVGLVYLDGDHSYSGVMNNFCKIIEHLDENSVLILDDIRWSKGMKKAWLEIAGHHKTTLAVDLFSLGIVFFNPSLSKQIIPVGY
jgi:predicted O-methyltransferase YrrM